MNKKIKFRIWDYCAAGAVGYSSSLKYPLVPLTLLEKIMALCVCLLIVFSFYYYLKERKELLRIEKFLFAFQMVFSLFIVYNTLSPLW